MTASPSTTLSCRDAAYEGLSYRSRRSLHGRAGDAIEVAAGANPEDQAELLSLHFLHAQRHTDAWRYALVAAERARAIYANLEAAEFYERALEAGRHLAHADAGELVEVHERLGQVRERAGAFERADTAYRAARRLVGGDVVSEARLLLRLARLQGLLDRYSRGLGWLTRGLRRLEGVDGTAAAGQRSQLIAAYAQFCMDEGHARRAITWCRRAIDAAATAGDREAEAQARKVWDWALLELGELEEPTNYMRSLALYEELDDIRGQSNILNNLGVVAYWKGSWDEAIELWQRSRDLVERTGDSVTSALITLNTAEIEIDQGRLDEARVLLDEALPVLRAAGHRFGVVLAKLDLGRVAYLGGRPEDGLRLLGEAGTEASGLGAQALVFEAQARTAECRLFAGDAAGARRVADETMERVRAVPGAAALVLLLHRVRGLASLRLGDRAAAEAAFAAQPRGGALAACAVRRRAQPPRPRRVRRGVRGAEPGGSPRGERGDPPGARSGCRGLPGVGVVGGDLKGLGDVAEHVGDVLNAPRRGRRPRQLVRVRARRCRVLSVAGGTPERRRRRGCRGCRSKPASLCW